jgi:thiosulfate dehydrogenase [quinone] large subunit
MDINLTKSEFSFLLMRLVAGTLMFFAGIEKVLYTTWGGHTSGWSAGFYLSNIAGGGAFNSWFQSLAGSQVVNDLVIWGEVLIGLGLLIGFLTRLAAYSGIVMNGLFWISQYMASSRTSTGALAVNAGPWGNGWANGPLNNNFLLIVMYIIIILVGAGVKWGLDRYVHDLEFVKNNSWLKVIFG